RELLERTSSEGGDAFARLVESLRAAADADAGVLLEAARAEEIPLRRAAAQVAPHRQAPLAGQAVAALLRDKAAEVRRSLAEALVSVPAGRLDDAVAQLLEDGEEEVRYLAVQAARTRPNLETTLAARLSHEEEDLVRQAIARALATAGNPSVLPSLIS